MDLQKATKADIKDDKLYKSQEQAINKLADWYHSKELECTLEGFAGTGKTYLLKYFIENVVDKSFVVTAPTHKALRVLENNVGRKGKTLHSLHGLKPNTDLANFDIERPQFDPLGEPTIKNYNLVIIDECSMINSSLFRLNRQRAKDFNTKILYVGDSLQLPPVNEVISPTFAAVENKVVLTDIVRQEKGNPLLELFILLRYDIKNKTNKFLEYIITNRSNIKGDVGYEILPLIEFKKTILDIFKSDDFITNIDYFRLTTYTNNAISYWNTFIRDNFIGKNVDIININDLFTSYNTIVDEFRNPIILNSEDYIIEDIRPYVSDEGIKTFAVNLKSMYDSRITSPFLIVDHTDESFNKYLNILNLLHNRAISGVKSGWYVYYKFKNKYLTLKSFTLPDSKKIVKKDVDYGYALTTHKLQGSTFDNIAIDLKNIVYYNTANGMRQVEQDIRNKLIYVALSRAKHKAIIRY